MKKYQVSDRVSIFVKRYRNTDSSVSIRFLFNDSRIMLDFVLASYLVSILKQFNGSRTISDIIESSPALEKQIMEMFILLKKHKVLTQKNEENIIGSRYKRQLNFFGSFEDLKLTRFGMQKKLKKSIVGIVGLGGIGSWVVEQLSRSGVGGFILIDPDHIEDSNLSRQAIYTVDSIGELKVDCVEKFIKKINHNAFILKDTTLVRSPQDLNCLTSVDLIINCADSPDTDTTNLIVSDYAMSKKIPHILCGGYNGHHSYIGPTVIPGKTPCWNCYVLSGKYEKSLLGFEHLLFRNTEIEGGTLAPIAITTASIHALEAIKIITGFAKPIFTGKIAEYDFFLMNMHQRKFKFNKNCQHCKKIKNE